MAEPGSNSKPGSNSTLAAVAATVASHTQSFFRRRLWVWPLIAAAMLAFVGLWVRAKMEGAIQAEIAGNLKTIRDANVEALRAWAATMKTQAELLAEDEQVRSLIETLLKRAAQQGTSQAVLTTAPEFADLRAHLKPAEEGRGFAGYSVLATNLVVVAAAREQFLGAKAPPNYAEQLAPCFAGNATVTPPFATVAMLPDNKGDRQSSVPVMFAAAPVRSANGLVIAVLALRILPERDFTRILATARSGASGETYAFNRDGLLLSESRFDEDLKKLGLIPDSDEARSLLALDLRDPLVDLSRGRRPAKRRAELPYIKAVSEASAGRDGLDVRGYRDYRGVPVVGAWTWLPEFDMGLVTQLDVAEALAPARVVRAGFWALFGLLALGSVVVFILIRVARQAALRAKQLGQYTLDEEIGAGAFGMVFRGHHALMRRPVAVKVLDPAADERSIARFEREVQTTCQLNHPNTIALYDYGRTDDGLFYYAMEYLDGLSLSELIKQHGPQPEGRIIHILRQACASLAEAHARGLVHRDIKPQNIFLTRRGGIPDFVKVLDFGLVKTRDLPGQLELTTAHATLGTPLYMAPEAVKGPDQVSERSDLYSLASVGYELLTGETVFCGMSLGEVLLHQVRSQPDKPSARMRRPVSADLEDLLMRCLAKNPSARPASASELDEALGHCVNNGTWTRRLADEWWKQHVSDEKSPLPIKGRKP
ncbi:MAG TPA: serine/threonine protein kinase [Verrucomicrobiae bacterium]